LSKKVAHIGQMDRRVELIKYDKTITDTGERTKIEVSLGFVWSKLQDVSGTEEIEGKVISLSVRRYIIRWRNDVVQSGVTFYIKDEDGEYNVHSVEHQGRKEYLVLKSSKRE